MSDNMPSPVTLEFLAQQQTRIIRDMADQRSERADLRADMAVLLAIVQRLDGTVAGLLDAIDKTAP